MKKTRPPNDASGARPLLAAFDPPAAEMKPNALGAPRLELLSGSTAGLRFGASFVEAGELRPETPRATFGEDDFADEEEEALEGEEEEDEFGDDEDEDDDEFEDDDEDEDEDDEFEEDAEEEEDEFDDEEEDDEFDDED